METGGEAHESRPWPARAACIDADHGLFFPGPHDSTNPALQFCARCPVRRQCLDYALAVDERFGIWGGMTSARRRLLRRREA
jgi:WhiB family redox-sensing transcriptional regulator